MKKITVILTFLISVFVFSQQQTITYSVTPASFDENQNITITINGSSVNEATWGVAGNALYLWTWSFDSNDVNILDCPTNGSWTNSNEANRLTYNSGNDTYTMSFVPSSFYARTNMGRIGFLVKAKDGTGDKKSQDVLVEVGLFQSTLTSPVVSSTTIINSGGSLLVEANNNNGIADYNLKANGVSINTVSGVNTYSYNHTNIVSNQNYVLEITQGAITQTKSFMVIVNPSTVSEAMPSGLENGINYLVDNTKAVLVLEAPGKDFVYVAGSFNNWEPTSSYAMKRDPTTNKFWLELTGLTAEQIESYQYWVVDETPIANSPILVKVADPCSTLVLSPFDDSWIPSATYPNLPTYPVEQEREVTVLQTGQTPYNWQVTNFNKPNKDNLVVYEILIRDFDADRNFQDVIDKIDYLKNLGINAIELMPIMEFEGNESWGYNTSFHMALDKFYGTKEKLKELIDLCHQNDIAVVLDLAFNHAFGRNPMVRMWMDDPDGDGWGSPSIENPYFNTVATHSYSVGEDFNHTSDYTKNYVKQTLKYWINEFKIDGFRWDLTKGFTQNATGSDALTNQFQQDRVDVLKEYADYSWSLDPDHYVIFEHLGSDTEEQEWANYRIGEGKGIMMWGELFSSYKQLALGYASNGSIARMGHVSRGFTGKRLMGYPESHDKDRLMYEAVTYGVTGGTSPVGGNLPNALNRAGAIGATSILIPGPKMIWHFQELGMDDSIYTCSNGTVNTESDGIAGDCKLDTKPQPQWTENWLNDPVRGAIYQDYAKLIHLKNQEVVFNGEYTISPESGNNLKQRIYIYDNSLPSTALKNVVVLANFSTSDLTIVPDFPYTGNWHDLMDDTSFVVTNTAAPISIAAGEFKVYGNEASVLSSEVFDSSKQIIVYPNPVKNVFSVSREVEKIELFAVTGQKVKTFSNVSANNELNVQDLERGIYLVKLFYNDVNFVVQKMVKQ
ncbi:alpha-amylase family glycosyl hydrolase [Flavobacterium sp.]|uniref:alpha-amylase family glycosyl hydrolase n=2 Tax=Flavobacterium sp. TaxID=239 RepID=UPI00404835E5